MSDDITDIVSGEDYAAVKKVIIPDMWLRHFKGNVTKAYLMAQVIYWFQTKKTGAGGTRTLLIKASEEEGDQSWCSLPHNRVARRLGVNSRTVQRAAQDLEHLGYLRVDPNSGDSVFGSLYAPGPALPGIVKFLLSQEKNNRAF